MSLINVRGRFAQGLVASGLLLAVAPARAQSRHAKDMPPPPAADKADDKGPTVKVTKGEGGRTVIKIEGIVVKGTVQKPEAFYILHRSTINYDWEALKQDFVPKVLESVKHSPF